MNKQEHIDRISSIRRELYKAHKDGKPTHGWRGKLRDAYLAGKEHREVRDEFHKAMAAIDIHSSGDCQSPIEPHDH